MTRTTTLFLGAALAAGSLLAACGDDATPVASPTTQAGGTMTQEQFCDMVRNYELKSDEFDGMFDAGTPDPATLEAAFTAMQGLQANLTASAPAEIKADAQTTLDGVEQMVTLFEAHDWDIMALAASDDIDEFQALSDDPELAAAGERLDQWAFDTCGIPLDS